MSEPIALQSGEKILLKLRKHWIILVRDTGATALLAILPFFLFGTVSILVPSPYGLGVFTSFGALVSSLWLLVVWLTLAAIWTAYYLDLWIVTDRRIISVDQIGLFHRTVTSLNLEDIQEITVHTENPLEALFHFGRIQIETAGPNDEPAMEGIPHPERMRSVILEQVYAHKKHEENDETQEELFRTTSHEIKNYLAKDAAALAEIAAGEYDARPAAAKAAAGRALSEARKGVKVVMDILDTGGAMKIRMLPFDLSATLETITREYEIAARKKGLSFEVAASSPCVINGDEEKLGRILIKNLLDNALHYTPGGGIKVMLEKSGSVARIAIADTGVGLSAEDQEKLFTPGGKGEDSRAINPESTGYGLAIVKQLVEVHGGRIWAESEGRGKGSTFIVELPLAQ